MGEKKTVVGLLILLAIIGLTTIFAIIRLAGKFSVRYRSLEQAELYEDEDGAASEESQKACSAKVQRGLLCGFSISGFCIGLATGILSLQEHGNGREWRVGYWVQFAIWTLLLVQTANVVTEKNPPKRYNFALQQAGCFTLQLVIFILANLDWVTGQQPAKPRSKADEALTITNAVLAVCGLLSCLWIPRRPEVYFDGSLVDRKWTASAASRFTFGWAVHLMTLANNAGRKLNFEEIPVLDHTMRAKSLYESFKAMKRQGRLVKLIIFAHSRMLMLQWLLTIGEAIFTLTPQLAMFNLLKLLERRDAGIPIGIPAVLGVLALGLGILAASFFANWMWWISYGHLNIPVRVQLSALIFTKAMRRKDIKGVKSKKKDKSVVGTAKSSLAIADAHDTPEKLDTEDDDAEETMQKTRQGVINLIGVDTKRVAEVAFYNNLFFGSIVKMAIAFTFLGKLVGWQALLAGLAVQLLFLPLNVYFSNRYTRCQEELMKARDQKLAVLNEALGGIRQIKFAALERQWQKKIAAIREKELKVLWRSMIADTFVIFSWLIGPILLSTASISVYAIIHHGLPPSVAFTTIAILAEIEGTLAYIPELLTNVIDAAVSVRRINEFLDAPEKVQNTVSGEAVSFESATVAWPAEEQDDDEKFTLRDLNISFPNGELSVISGRTGSGKSLLLAAILGEAEVLEGKIFVPRAPPLHERYDHKANKSNWTIPSALAFVSQQPWIENCSFKDNILFGLPFDEERYNKVVSVCALEKDVELLTDGHETEIGANGINLSGGQRWRITLARALYSRSGILIMDDIFSAVDAHVGKHIYEQALTGDICQGRTRILVTHHVSLCLPQMKYEVHLGDGTVDHAGFVNDLRQTGELDTAIEEENEEVLSENHGGPSELSHAGDKVVDSSLRRTSTVSSSRRRTHAESSGTNGKLSRTSTRSAVVDNDSLAASKKAIPKKFVEEEKRETGWVNWKVYKSYLQAGGGLPFWFLVLVLFGGYQALLLGRSWVLRLWTDSYSTESKSTFLRTRLYEAFSPPPNNPQRSKEDNFEYYLFLYLGIAVAITIEGGLRYLWVFYGSIKASRKLFDDLAHAVLRAPMRWLDTVPVGRILNRFTADFNMLDSSTATNIAFMLYNCMMLIGVVIAGFFISPYIIFGAIILFALCVWYALYFLSAAREVKRLESIARSPIFELFGVALTGLTTIRAFAKTDTYITQMFARIDRHARSGYYMWLFNRWLGWRLSVTGAVFTVLIAGLIVSLRNIDAALAGFALGFALQFSEAIQWFLRQFAHVELGMNATERIIEYSNIKIEDTGGEDAPAAWPSEGKLEVENLVVGYADDLPAVLQGLTFNIKKNERVGVVGRTGAGKSSLTLALFRFLEAREGKILIDGLDISKIKLHDLRSRLAIIPQDPVLFSGTVRSNLDPFNEHSDQELRDALERVHLVESGQTTVVATPQGERASSTASSTHEDASNSRDAPEVEASGSSTPKPSGTVASHNTNPFTSLSSPISESGHNLSQGQRQLLCLARAIVSRPKIMVLDEATSAVDKATDALIQRSIREEFQDATLVVIAHRLSTIADFDRILVMGEGKVKEIGTPRELLEKSDAESAEGVFRSMVEDSGERELLKEIILGEGAEDGGVED